MRPLVLPVIVLGLAACERAGDGVPAAGVDRPADATAERDEVTLPSVDLEVRRRGLARWVAERERELDVRIDALERRGDATSVALLRAKRDQARAMLTDLGARTEENWHAFEHDVEQAWDALARDVQEAWLR